RVAFLGAVSPERLVAYYRHAIASLLPTISFETFGMVMIESLSHGTPVLARRGGAPVEILQRCRGGELFDDAAGLLAAARRLQGEPEYRERLTDAALRGYREHWSEEAVLPRYLDVIRRAAERRGRAELASSLSAQKFAPLV